ncbi:MAG: hypothetical protein AAF721_15410 [Myxococcota bacterium]
MSETLDLALRWQASVGAGIYARLGLVTLLPAALLCYAAHAVWDYRWRVVWLLAFALSTVLQGCFTVAASKLMFEREVATGGIVREFLRHLSSFIGGLLFTRLITAIACIIIVGPLWSIPRSIFVQEATLLERQDAAQAVGRAAVLNQEHATPLLVLVLVMLGTMVAGAIAGDQLSAFVLDASLQLGRPAGDLLVDGGSLGALVGFFAVVPYIATAQFLSYIDSRTQRDGWDVQLAFVALSERRSDR